MFPRRGPSDMWGHSFGSHAGGGLLTGIWRVGTRDTTEHRVMPRTAPTTRISSAGVEKSCLNEKCSKFLYKCHEGLPGVTRMKVINSVPNNQNGCGTSSKFK